MYIREKNKTRDGVTYTQHQLIESVRTPAGPRQTLVLNLGTLTIGRDEWKELANRIESLLHGSPSLFPSSLEVERLSEYYAKLIRRKRLSEGNCAPMKEDAPTGGEQDYVTVDLNSLENSDALSIGAEHAVVEQLREYGFEGLLESLGFTSLQATYAMMLVVSRLIHPAKARPPGGSGRTATLPNCWDVIPLFMTQRSIGWHRSCGNTMKPLRGGSPAR